MTINYANGSRSVECDSEDEARTILDSQYPDAVYCDQWDADGPGHERLLVWASEEDSIDDAGQRSVAEIVREAE